MARLFFCLGVCGLLLVNLAVLAPRAAAQIPRPESPHPYMQTEADGLPRIYQFTEAECQKMLAGADRWFALPRAIANVLAEPSLPPAFDLSNPRINDSNLSAGLTAARTSFKRSWPGGARLVYHNQILAIDGDDVWLLGKPNTLQLVSGGRWSSYRPFGYGHLLAKRADGLWCLGNDLGLHWLQNGTFESLEIPGWTAGSPQGLVADGRGRILAWKSGSNQLLVTVYSDGQWSSLVLPRSHHCTVGGIRPDGSVVLAGSATVIVAKLPAGVLTEVSAPSLKTRSFPISDEQAAEMTYSTVRLPSGEDKTIVSWFDSRTVSGTPHVTRTGAALFAVPSAAGNPAGLMRLAVDSPPEWIEFDPGFSTFTIHAARDGGFYLFEPKLGIFELKKNSKKPARLTERGELLASDRFLGSDSSGRIYLRRGEAILALAPHQKPAATQPVRELMSRQKKNVTTIYSNRPEDPSVPYVAAVDSQGALWCIDGAGTVLKWRGDEQEPQRLDERLADATSLWPGRGGAMLLMGGKSVALVHGNHEVATASSLLELARQNFDALLAAAPLASRDQRRFLPTSGYFIQARQGAPWLAIGNSLWLADGKQVHRLKREGEGDQPPVQSTVVETGPYELIGPLASGSLVLAKFSYNAEYLQTWRFVSEPDGGAAAKSLILTPSGNTGMPPSTARNDWQLDASNQLCLHSGFVETHLIGGPNQWREHKSRGILQFDDGVPWCFWSNEAMGGYQVGKVQLERPCRPTYVQRLTPLFADGDRVACLTPLGCAWLQVAFESPDNDAVVATKNLQWTSTPSIYIGHSGRQVFMMSSDAKLNSVIAFEMPQ